MRYPVAFVIPVILAAWYSGRAPALALAVAVTSARIAFQLMSWTPSATLSMDVAETVARGIVVALVGLWFARLVDHERALHHHVSRLEGLLPICSFCKSIRNAEGQWEPLERFISTRSEAQFSHSFCPPCLHRHYPATTS
jgi:hypothetical protein